MSKGYSEKTYYSCDYCDLEAVFDDVEAVKEHHKMCLMNPENKFPLTSRHVVLKAYGWGAKNHKKWKTDKVYFQLTPFMRPFNKLLDRELEEEELYQEDETWEAREAFETGIPVEKTQSFHDFMELLDEQDDVEEINEQISAITKGIENKQ